MFLAYPAFMPSPVLQSYLVFHPSETISSCLKKMRAAKKGAALIVEKSTQKLLGIFTERDLLHHYPYIFDKNNLEKSIQILMHKDPLCITTKDIQNASKIMIEHEIRHIPVVENMNSKKVIGILSMRGLFKSMPAVWNTKIELSSIDLPLGVISKDPEILKLAKRTVPSLTPGSIKKISSHLSQWKTEFQIQKIHSFKSVILDLEGLAQKDWKLILQKLLSSPKKQKITILYDSSLLPEKAEPVLKKLASPWVYISSKPFDLALWNEYFRS